MQTVEEILANFENSQNYITISTISKQFENEQKITDKLKTEINEIELNTVKEWNIFSNMNAKASIDKRIFVLANIKLLEQILNEKTVILKEQEHKTMCIRDNTLQAYIMFRRSKVSRLSRVS